LSDLRTLEKVSPQTQFNLGSISKTFVSNAILILQSQRKLSVEDNLLKYFPDFENKDIANSVKIKHLLTHTSGLPDIRFPSKDSVFYLTARDQENWNPIMKATALNFDPGSKFEYSNPAFNALALIIEKVNRGKWQDFIIKNILIPSGMLSSTITDGSHPETGVAHGYIKIRNQWVEKDYGEEPTFAAAGNGGVWSSVEEMALYDKALSNYLFLSKEDHADATTIKEFPNWSDGELPKIGWSWFIGKTSDGYKSIGHTGSQGGFRANYVSVPEKKLLIVMLSSAPKPLDEYTDFVLDYLQNRK
jgi:CubicO group peptidase (beta-lactamase class C family)